MKPVVATGLILYVVCACLLTTSHGRQMRWENEHGGLALPINPLRPLTGSGRHPIYGLSCDSWRFAVETNNLRDWATIPDSCEKYVGNYMLGDRYRADSLAVVTEAIAYAESLQLKGDGKDVWVFDIDETSLCNLPYYEKHGFGAELYNWVLFNEWVSNASAPPLPETLKLYNKLQILGIKPVFLTGRHEDKRNATILNIGEAGYHTWERLILKGSSLSTSSAVKYKSGERKKLVDEGYRIVGNIGDQWSDLLGAPEGDRTFKLPDPMYYIS